MLLQWRKPYKKIGKWGKTWIYKQPTFATDWCCFTKDRLIPSVTAREWILCSVSCEAPLNELPTSLSPVFFLFNERLKRPWLTTTLSLLEAQRSSLNPSSQPVLPTLLVEGVATFDPLLRTTLLLTFEQGLTLTFVLLVLSLLFLKQGTRGFFLSSPSFGKVVVFENLLTDGCFVNLGTYGFVAKAFDGTSRLVLLVCCELSLAVEHCNWGSCVFNCVTPRLPPYWFPMFFGVPSTHVCPTFCNGIPCSPPVGASGWGFKSDLAVGLLRSSLVISFRELLISLVFLVQVKGWLALESVAALVRFVCFDTEARWRIFVGYKVEDVNVRGEPQTLGIRNVRSCRNDLNIALCSHLTETCGSSCLMQHSGYLVHVKKFQQESIASEACTTQVHFLAVDDHYRRMGQC